MKQLQLREGNVLYMLHHHSFSRISLPCINTGEHRASKAYNTKKKKKTGLARRVLITAELPCLQNGGNKPQDCKQIIKAKKKKVQKTAIFFSSTLKFSGAFHKAKQ